MKFEPIYYKDKLEIINPKGRVGVITLWSKPEKIKEKIKSVYPKLFKADSPLVTITSLYGNGLPQMLANLAYNPQIDKIAIVGNDTSTVPSSKFLVNFLEQGIINEKVGGVEMSKIKDTGY